MSENGIPLKNTFSKKLSNSWPFSSTKDDGRVIPNDNGKKVKKKKNCEQPSIKYDCNELAMSLADYLLKLVGSIYSEDNPCNRKRASK